MIVERTRKSVWRKGCGRRREGALPSRRRVDNRAASQRNQPLLCESKGRCGRIELTTSQTLFFVITVFDEFTKAQRKNTHTTPTRTYGETSLLLTLGGTSPLYGCCVPPSW